MAAVISMLVLIAIPAIFFATTYKYETLRINSSARIRADMLSTFIYKHPDFWKFNVPRLEEILQHQTGNPQLSLLIDLNDKTIASSQPAPENEEMQTSLGLHMEGIATVFEGRVHVGSVHVVQSLSPIVVSTSWVGFFSLFLAGAIFAILKTLSLRALQDRITQMQETEQTLETQVVELEETHRKLKLQGETVTRMADDLREAHDDLEQRVHERTLELENARDEANAAIYLNPTLLRP